MTQLRLLVRGNAFEAFGIGAAGVAAFGVASFVIVRLTAFELPLECFLAAACPARQLDVAAYLQFAYMPGLWAVVGLALVPSLGIVLGVALLAKELDRGTTAFAWSLAPSRRRWLLARVVPVALLFVGVALLAGVAADRIEALRDPGLDPRRSFSHLGFRGPVLAAEGFAFLGVTLAAGSALGRILPSLLLGGLLSVVSFVGITFLDERLLAGETVVIAGQDGGVPDRVVESLVIGPDGSILTWNEAYARYGDPSSPTFVEPGGDPGLHSALRVNPVAIYPLVEARLGILYGAVGLAGIAVAFAVVDRRRP